MQQLNSRGGILARTQAELRRAKEVDLITLPISIDGTNCGNCKFIRKGMCTNTKVDQPVNNRMCCVLWSNAGEYRQFTGRNERYD